MSDFGVQLDEVPRKAPPGGRSPRVVESDATRAPVTDPLGSATLVADALKMKRFCQVMVVLV